MRDHTKEGFRVAGKMGFYILIVTAILILTLSSSYLMSSIDLISTGGEISSNILKINAAAIIVLTAILVCVGWFQLGNQTIRVEYSHDV